MRPSLRAGGGTLVGRCAGEDVAVPWRFVAQCHAPERMRCTAAATRRARVSGFRAPSIQTTYSRRCEGGILAKRAPAFRRSGEGRRQVRRHLAGRHLLLGRHGFPSSLSQVT